MQLLVQAVGLLADLMNAYDFNVSAVCRPPICVVPVEELVLGMEMVLGEGLAVGFQVPVGDRLARLPIKPLWA